MKLVVEKRMFNVFINRKHQPVTQSWNQISSRVTCFFFLVSVYKDSLQFSPASKFYFVLFNSVK